jgi:hypothetical protein
MKGICRKAGALCFCRRFPGSVRAAHGAAGAMGQEMAVIRQKSRVATLTAAKRRA